METKLVNILPDMNRDPTLTRSTEEVCAKCDYNEGNFDIPFHDIHPNKILNY